MERNGLVGKRISIYFDDGQRITRHDGICTDNTPTEIYLDGREMILKSRIVRVEAIR